MTGKVLKSDTSILQIRGPTDKAVKKFFYSG